MGFVYRISSAQRYLTTMGRRPTLSAGRKILVAAKAAHYRRPQSFGDMVLTDRGFATEIAQFTLGDLDFKVHTPHFTHSSAFVKHIVGHHELDFDSSWAAEINKIL